MRFSTIIAAIALPMAALAADAEPTTTITSTSYVTQYITLNRVAATESANATITSTKPTGTGSSGSSTTSATKNGASGLAPMALAGFAGMVVVALF